MLALHFNLQLHIGTILDGVSGMVPAREGEAVSVAWSRVSGGANVTLILGSDTYIRGWPTSPTTWVKLSGTVTATIQGDRIK